MLTLSQKKIDDIQKKKELNKNQISEIIYCTKVLECLILTKIDSLDINKVLLVKEFFLCSGENNYDSLVNKILKIGK